MTLEKFKEEIKALNDEIKAAYGNEDHFIDGPLNPEEYYNNKGLKIMWLMKEAYGDPFSYPDFYLKENDKFLAEIVLGRPKFTWGPVVNISHMLLNKISLWDGIDSEAKIEKVLSLDKIAWVNIQKMPSKNGSKTNMSDILQASNKYQILLERQIKLLNPDVVICGNTFESIKHYFGNPQLNKFNLEGEFVPNYTCEGRFFIDPYHPGYTAPRFGKIDLEQYINDIVRTINQYLEEKKIP